MDTRPVREAIREILADPAFPEGGAWVRRSYAANQRVVRKGELGRSLFLVEEGELRVAGRVTLDDDREVQPGIGDLHPGDLFGEFCLFDPSPRTASVTAISAARLIEIDGESLSQYLEAHPGTGYRFLKETLALTIARLGVANRRVEKLFAWGLKAHGIEEHL